MLLQFFTLLLERNVFAIKWHLKAIAINHTTRWSFFSAFPAEGAETVGLCSLGRWDLAVFIASEKENSVFLLLVMQDWARLHSYMAISVIFTPTLLMIALVPVLCFCRVRLCPAVLGHTLESFQVQAYMLEWHSNSKAARISAFFLLQEVWTSFRNANLSLFRPLHNLSYSLEFDSEVFFCDFTSTVMRYRYLVAGIYIHQLKLRCS